MQKDKYVIRRLDRYWNTCSWCDSKARARHYNRQEVLEVQARMLRDKEPVEAVKL